MLISKKNTRIDKIHVENNQIKGVFYKGSLIRAKVVLSNGNLKRTILQMVGREHFSSEYLLATEKVRMNSSSCQVYIGLKPREKIKEIGDLIFVSKTPIFNTKTLLEKRTTSRTFSIYYAKGRPYDETPRYAIVSSY